MMKVCVFGMGYVGTTLAVALARNNYQVYAVEKDRKKRELISHGRCPIRSNENEDSTFKLDQMYKKVKQRIHNSDAARAIRESDICFICVNTPQGKGGKVVVKYVNDVIRTISKNLNSRDDYLLVVLKSTVPVGTSEQMIRKIESISGKKCGKDFGFCMNPEFLREASPLDDFFYPFFIIIGAYDNRSYNLLHTTLKDCIIGRDVGINKMGLNEAEIFKYINNTFHAMKVTFANEVKRICDRFDLNAKRLMKIFCEDKRLNISDYYLKPGQPFGGSCLPKDTLGMMIMAKGISTPLIDSIIRSNEVHKKHEKESSDVSP